MTYLISVRTMDEGVAEIRFDRVPCRDEIISVPPLGEYRVREVRWRVVASSPSGDQLAYPTLLVEKIG